MVNTSRHRTLPAAFRNISTVIFQLKATGPRQRRIRLNVKTTFFQDTRYLLSAATTNYIMFISQTAVVRTITTDHFTDTECGINTSHNPSFRHHNMSEAQSAAIMPAAAAPTDRPTVSIDKLVCPSY